MLCRDTIFKIVFRYALDILKFDDSSRYQKRDVLLRVDSAFIDKFCFKYCNKYLPEACDMKI